MRAVIQRVTSAKVEVEGKVTGEIGKGFLILFGVGQEDTEADCDKLADKISKLRIFADERIISPFLHSRMIVKGPSLSSETFMYAPKTPFSTLPEISHFR